METPRRYDLQDRLVDYAVAIIGTIKTFDRSDAGRHVRSQLLRSGTSPAPNYGEAQSAESRADFIHKLKIALKELRESEVWLRVAERAELTREPQRLQSVLKETNELVSILVTSIGTARRNADT